MMKSTTVPRKSPYRMAFTGLPAASTLPERFQCQARQSPFGEINPIGGIRMSLTSAVTTFPDAAPMMTPTASARALDFVRNSLNSLSMAILLSQGVRGSLADLHESEGRFPGTLYSRAANRVMPELAYLRGTCARVAGMIARRAYR